MNRAMKSIKKKSILKEDEERMFAEMNILKDLDHPNILKLYELFQDENNYYLITEYSFCFKWLNSIFFLTCEDIVAVGNYLRKSKI